VAEKVLTLLLMAATTLLCGLLPYRLLGRGRQEAGTTLVSLASCFSGGVFIAACLLDLLPETEEKIQEVLKQLKNDTEYPIAEFLVCCGFFIILTIEQGVLHCQEVWLRKAEDREALVSGGSPGEVTVSTYNTVPHHHHHQHHQHHHHHHQHQHSALRSLMLLVALSFHSVFEGIAIGVQDTSAQLLSIFLAVMVHKALMAFSLGLNLAQADLGSSTFLLSTAVFTLASPLGIGVGILMSDLPPSTAGDIFNGVLQGVAGGTFLYVTFFEVLPHELNVPGRRLLKVGCVILGYVALAGLLYVAH